MSKRQAKKTTENTEGIVMLANVYNMTSAM